MCRVSYHKASCAVASPHGEITIYIHKNIDRCNQSLLTLLLSSFSRYMFTLSVPQICSLYITTLPGYTNTCHHSVCTSTLSQHMCDASMCANTLSTLSLTISFPSLTPSLTICLTPACANTLVCWKLFLTTKFEGAGMPVCRHFHERGERER